MPITTCNYLTSTYILGYTHRKLRRKNENGKEREQLSLQVHLNQSVSSDQYGIVTENPDRRRKAGGVYACILMLYNKYFRKNE